MRLLHTSDLHLGRKLNGFSLIEDQRHILSQIRDIAKDRSVDAVLIAGDIYDKTSPSAEAVTLFDQFLTDLSEARIPVLAVPGNHDSAERIAYAQSLLARQGVSFPPVYEGTLAQVELNDEHGPVRVWLVPFLKPSDVRPYFPAADIKDSYTAALREALAVEPVNPAQRNIAVVHQFITAGKAEPELAGEELQLGGIDNVDASVFDDFDYVALGHVHRPQRIGRENVRYAGSPLKYSLSEARYEKSVTIVEAGKKSAGDAPGACVSVEKVTLAPLHDVRVVRDTLENVLDQAKSEDSDKRADYVHVTLADTSYRLDAASRIREVYPNLMGVDYDNVVVSGKAAPARKAVDPDELSMADLFAKFFEEQVGRSLTDEQRKLVEARTTDVVAADAQEEDVR